MPKTAASDFSLYPLPPLERRIDFVAAGKHFASRESRRLAFRFLQFFLRCSDEDLAYVMGKIYCDALPVSYNRHENMLISCWKSTLQPLYYAIKKSYFWRPSSPVDFDFETVDAAYFKKWYVPIYDKVSGSKRLTPSVGRALKEPASAAAMDSCLTPRCLALLLTAPLFIPSLLALSLRYGLNFIPAYRKALGLYALFDGHFRRYPCRHFLAYADESNHPSRYLAFRQNCLGFMSVVQNGERTLHPAYAFGMMDYYLAFGPYLETLASRLHMRLRKVIPVGALYLNSRTALARKDAQADLYDVLFIDQTIWPYNDFDRKTGKSFEKIFRNINALKRRKPGLRIAYQLRVYSDLAQKNSVLETIGRFFTEKIEILENSGSGESYENILRSRLVMTFNSTMGYEAFFMGKGKKVLFVNHAGNPYEIYSDDARFQLYDETGEYDRFERHVEYLLSLKLEGLPDEVGRRHAYFDGRVQERIADFLNREDFR